MNSHTLEDRVEFLQFEPVRRILFVLGRDIAGGPGHAGFLVLGALQDHLYSVAFFSHGAIALVSDDLLDDTFLFCLLEHCRNPLPVNRLQCPGRYLEGNPAVLLRDIKTLL